MLETGSSCGVCVCVCAVARCQLQKLASVLAGLDSLEAMVRAGAHVTHQEREGERESSLESSDCYLERLFNFQGKMCFEFALFSVLVMMNFGMAFH